MAVQPIEVPDGIDRETAERYLKQVAGADVGQRRLQAALERSEKPVGPGTAWQLASAERLLRQLITEHGVYTSAEIAELRGGHRSSRSVATNLAKRENLLALPRGRGKVYPAFQLRGSAVDPQWKKIVGMFREAGDNDQSILLWAAAKNSQLGASPAELIAAGRGDQVLRAAEQETADVW